MEEYEDSSKIGESFSIHHLPSEILSLIFTYLKYYDRKQAILVCKWWRKIGQQFLFTSRECLKLVNCTLGAAEVLGDFLLRSDRQFLNLRIGRGVNMVPSSMEIIQKVGKDVRELQLMGNLVWELNLIEFLQAFPLLQKLEIGSFLEQQVNTREFFEFLASSKIKEIAIHNVKDEFVHCFTNALAKISNKLFTLYFPDNSEHRDKFNRFLDRISGSQPNRIKLLELTVPFKLKALQALSKLSLNISELRKLEITSPKSFDELKHECQRMPCLRELVLWRGCLDFQLFDVFDYLVKLETLRIQSGIRLTQGSEFCENLHQKPCMKTLEVELIEGSINVPGFIKLVKCLPHLTSLSLSQSEIEDEHLCAVCDNLTNLTLFQVDFGKITNVGMYMAKWENLTKLEKLKISGCHKITDEAFDKFPRMNDLKEFRLNYMSKLTSRSIESVVKQCPHLEYLSLDGCDGIDDVGIELITKSLHRLRQLDLYCCVKITKKCVQYFVQHCTNLQYLDLSAINFDEDDKQELYRHVKTLRYIYDYDDGSDFMAKYFKGKTLRRRELYLSIQL